MTLRSTSTVLAVVCVVVAVSIGLWTTKMVKGSDLTVLRSLWFKRVKGSTHSERLESFYAPQASGYDDFRKRMLWARKPLLKQLSKELSDKRRLVWVDLGGGTGSNVEMMEDYIPIEHFEAIYVVDLCHSLCEEAKRRVQAKGWTNVHVVEEDACVYSLPETSSQADLITFSYALSMIPNFIGAVDKSMTFMRDDGWMGVCDFYVSARHDVPSRQMSWFRRFFWQMIFDLDGVFLGSERRLYLENRFETIWEENGNGSVPYVPFLRAPWYAWIGMKKEQRLFQ